MGYRIPLDSTASIITESGTSTSDENGYGTVVFTVSHNPNINIIISSEEASNCFLISKNALGFTFGTSSPFKKISYKAISVSP